MRAPVPTMVNTSGAIGCNACQLSYRTRMRRESPSKRTTDHVSSSALVGRPRPAVERLGTHQPTSSFPSGHVGAMTALAVALGRAAGPLPAPLRVTARAGLVGYLALLGWSRLYNGQHYASDVLAGYLNGSLAALIALRATRSAD